MAFSWLRCFGPLRLKLGRQGGPRLGGAGGKGAGVYRLVSHSRPRGSREWWCLSSGLTRLHYHRLSPNYDHFLGSDSDAVNSLDLFEIAAWYQSRGDETLNFASDVRQIVWGHPLIIRLHKRAGAEPGSSELKKVAGL